MKRLILFAAVAVLAILVSGCGDCTMFGYSRDLKGEVVRTPTSRFKAGTEERPGSQKIALTIKPIGSVDDTIQEIAGGPKGVVVECESTRCAQLEMGDCVWLECAHEHRWGEADVIKCKHKKDIACPKKNVARVGCCGPLGGGNPPSKTSHGDHGGLLR